MADIYSNIQTLRKSKNMTLEELGKRIGTTKQTIKRYEDGEIKSIPYDKIIALANALDTTPAELMGWSEAERNNPLYKEGEMIASSYNDKVLLSYIEKLQKLSPDKRDFIYNQIDYLLGK